eukprot:4302466-Alexandrium_andersonii.AAC.1
MSSATSQSAFPHSQCRSSWRRHVSGCTVARTVRRGSPFREAFVGEVVWDLGLGRSSCLLYTSPSPRD